MSKMSEAVVEDYLTCPVCLEMFREPVSLGCHHSFCSSCLQNYWDQNHCRTCPVCRRESSKDLTVINFALKELCISFSEKQKAKEGEKVCSKHPEVPPLFCLDEARALCAVCEFSLHKQHTVVPVETAVSELKEQLRSHLQSLTEKRERVKELEKSYEEMLRHSEKQAEHCEEQIRALFERLHQFLREEQESRLAELREEQRRQAHSLNPELENIREQLSSLSQSIHAVEQQLQRDSGAFLTHYSLTQSQASQPHPQPGSGLLINQARVLGNLGFKVWEKMRGLVQYSPVILDPNTAERSMYLSEDLTSVRHGEAQTLPSNPERFTNEPMVLGSEGFSSGTHQWDVEVGDLPTWDIGVVQESIDRKGQIFADYEYGIWCLWHGSGRYDNGSDQTVAVKKPPQKIRVQLDYDGGRVSFHDADDMTHLYTHRFPFSEKLFPYISVGPAAGAKTTEVRVF